MTTNLLTISDSKVVELLTNILANVTSKHDSAVTTAIIGLGGMLIVAIMSVVTQIFITRHIIKSDFKKIQTQIETEYDFKRKQEWIIQFRKIIADLVTETDPDSDTKFSKTRMIWLINQSQLMLDKSKPLESEIFGLITHIGLTINDRDNNTKYCEQSGDWENLKDYSDDILSLQTSIIDKTRILLCSM